MYISVLHSNKQGRYSINIGGFFCQKKKKRSKHLVINPGGEPWRFATWACLETHLPGFTAAPAGIRSDPKAPASRLFGQESKLPYGTAHKGEQVPTGRTEDTAAASQEEEGHGAKEKVCQLHGVPSQREGKDSLLRDPASFEGATNDMMVPCS